MPESSGAVAGVVSGSCTGTGSRAGLVLSSVSLGVLGCRRPGGRGMSTFPVEGDTSLLVRRCVCTVSFRLRPELLLALCVCL